MTKLSVKGLSLTMALLWGVGTLIVGIGAIYGWGQGWVDTMGSIYIGYAATWPGAFIGLAWAFVDGLIGGAVLAWLYNKIAGV
jgi:hypothetical protein